MLEKGTTSAGVIRVFYMDSLRAILMSLGVVLHAAMLFDTSRKWVLSDPSGSARYGVLVTLIHLYRMPVFFLIAGYFTLMAYARYSAAEFVRIRVTRIALPFIATLFTVNAALQFYFSVAHLRDFSVAHWVGQLWFLGYLFFYVVFFFTLTSCHGVFQRAAAILDRVARGRSGLVALYVLYVASNYLVRLTIRHFDLWDTSYLGFISVQEFLQYSVFFTIGLLIYSSSGAYRIFTQATAWICVVAFALGALAVAENRSPEILTQIGPFSKLLELSAQFFGAILIIGTFKRYLNVDSPGIRFFSDASYSIYLFHGPFLIAFAAILLNVDMPALMKFVLLVTSTLGCTLALHAALISRVPILNILYNGKLPRIVGVPKSVSNKLNS